MKKVLMVLTLLLSHLTYANSENIINPLEIKVANDHEVRLALSNQDINRLFVVNDRVTSINAPKNRLIAHNDATGSIFMNVVGMDPFTAFIETEKGRHFSLLILPKREPGATIKFIPKTPMIQKRTSHSVLARRFEQVQPYEKTLVNLLKFVMNGHTPPGYSMIPAEAFGHILSFKAPKYVNGRHNLSQKVVSGYLGGELAVRILKTSNQSKSDVTLVASDFYMTGVRAVAIAKETLAPHEFTYIYEVTSNV